MLLQPRAALVPLLFLAACPSGGVDPIESVPDAAVAMDASHAADAGTSSEDGGEDAGMQSGSDAGPGDAAMMDAGTPDASGPMCNGAPCKRAGAACTSDEECLGTCEAVLLDDTTKTFCVEACASQADCDAVGLRLYCAPTTVGGNEGRCIPRSPAHCLACEQDSECGTSNEVCAQLEGMDTKACLVDCSLSSTDACPSDYACVEVDVGGTMRSLCRPIGDCAGNEGGFCEHLLQDQPCTRANSDGVCTGVRTCQPSGRFSTCGAEVPACVSTCGAAPPEGCAVSTCASALTVPTACGSCANDCTAITNPGTVNASCTGTPRQCGYTCKGENYNVDRMSSNGCERADSPTGNHTQGTATTGPTFDTCIDAQTMFSFNGVMVSDRSTHENPVVASFDSVTGSAPDWFSVTGLGNCPGLTCICANNYEVTLEVTGSSMPDCYRLVFNEVPCDTDTTGTCTVTGGTGAYESGETLYFRVEKTCGWSMVTEHVTYTVSGHL